jgi:hypothetical protein
LNPVSPTTPSLILTICSQSTTTCGTLGDSVDVTITLPSSTTPNGTYLFDIELRVGNVSVQQAYLAAGSCVSTGTGNVTFKVSQHSATSSPTYVVLNKGTIRSQMAAATPVLGITGKSSTAPLA